MLCIDIVIPIKLETYALILNIYIVNIGFITDAKRKNKPIRINNKQRLKR